MRKPYNSIRCFRDVFMRELHRMASRPIYFYCILVAPIFCVFFFTSLMSEGIPHDLPVGVVDLDESTTSRRIIRTLDAMDQCGVAEVYKSYSDAREAMQRGKIYAFLYIPHHFSEDLQSMRRPELTYYISYSILVSGALIYKDMRRMVELAAASAMQTKLLSKGATERQVMGLLQPIVIDSHATFNPSLNYAVYLNNTILPGILMLLISLMTVYSIGSEVKENTARSWLERSNHSILLGVTAKLLPYTIMFFGMGLLCNLYLYDVLEYPCNSSWFPLMLLTLVMVLSAQALGLIFFALVPTLRMALSLCSLWGVLAFSISGFSFPNLAMSPFVRAISNLFPLRHYYLIYVSQTLDGNPISYSSESYVALLIFMLVPFVLFLRLKREIIHLFYIP